MRSSTTKWHRKHLSEEFRDPATHLEFREELADLLTNMRNCNHMLADITKVENLTDLGLLEGESH